MKPHKWKDVIISWANGAVVQWRDAYNDKWVTIENPIWLADFEYRASLAFVEGRPVFEGDVLYHTLDGVAFKMEKWHTQKWIDEHGFSWNPSQQTITVTIPRPEPLLEEGTINLPANISTGYVNLLRYRNREDWNKCYEIIKDAMK